METAKNNHNEADKEILFSKAIKAVLGWEPKYSDVETVLKTAWEWQRNKKY